MTNFVICHDTCPLGALYGSKGQGTFYGKKSKGESIQAEGEAGRLRYATK